MSTELCSSSLLHPALIVSLQNPPILPLTARTHKHRCLKKLIHRQRRTRPVACSASSGFDGLVHSLISAFPSVNSIELLIPALGFASGAALYLSSNNRWEQFLFKNSGVAGEWVLFASPTPFNRSVLLRCPSLSFDDAENFLAGANDLSVGKGRHYVTGRIPLYNGSDLQLGNGYQRICVPTKDGGVISLDWPDNLDLGKEHGLDTTLVLVPGSPEGSMDRDVMALVLVALRSGFFPIVMNPRGCAGSPVTTPRLFTAADSDDLCTAIQFIKTVRPLSTLMSIGFGYGANMLTKYLSEFGETVPITAAACINSPFDIEEATKSYPYNVSLDKKLTGGLIHILQTNKEIFQGKGKGFDMTRALSATSMREFDESISMISHGFKFVGDFYLKCSTRQLVENVKIPILYIQSDNSSVPLLSVPRNSIEENPFTSLLMCSGLSANITSSKRSSVIWCSHLIIEWLQAVEVALLKGRHPLLNDVDIPLKPSSEGIFSWNRNKIPGRSQLIQNYQLEDRRRCIKDPTSYVDGDNVFANVQHANINQSIHTEEVNVSGFENTLSNAGDIVNSMAEMDNGHVLATAEVILKMLEHTIPGSLDMEQKKKVLTAMEQGETLMKALETAVPENVRENLRNSVSEIMHVHGSSLNLEKLTKLGGSSVRAENLGSSNSETTGEKAEEQTNLDNALKENAISLGHRGNISMQVDASFPAENNIEGSVSAISHPEEGKKKIEISETDEKDASVKDEHEIDRERETQDHAMKKKDGMIEGTEDVNNRPANETVDPKSSEYASDGPSDSEGISFPSPNDVEVQTSQNGIHTMKTQHDHDKFGQNVERSTKSMSMSPDSPPSSSINVSEALDAFQSFDDSTQKAVNSVFGVIENVIDQLEKKPDRNGVERQEDKKVVDAPPRSLGNSCQSDEMRKCGLKLESEHDSVQSPDKCGGLSREHGKSHQNVESEHHSITKLHSSSKSIFGLCPETNRSFYYPHVDSYGKIGMYSFPGHLNINAFWESSYKEYLRRYFFSQMSNEKLSNLQPTTDLFLDTKKGQWKMLDQVEDSKYSVQDVMGKNIEGKDDAERTLSQEVHKEKIIGTSDVILDDQQSLKQSTADQLPSNKNGDNESFLNVRKERLIWLVKSAILDALRVEVRRKLGLSEVDKFEPVLASEMEAVAGSVAISLLCDDSLAVSLKQKDPASEKFGALRGKLVVDSISSAVLGANHLKMVLPMGVIVGTSLASLGRYFHISGANVDNINSVAPRVKGQHDSDDQSFEDTCSYDQHKRVDNLSEVDKKMAIVDSCNKNVMAGAAAILGASALLSHNKNVKNEDDEGIQSTSHNGKLDASIPQDQKDEEEDDEQNVVSSLAEKAISVVASPVVPTKTGGEIDHERLLSIFTELGQKGGLLKFFGNIALLWGGIRGAMSLTDRLIRFLRVAERPLIYRVVGFICMILVIWSPVAIPLLPHVVRSWTSKSSMGIAGYACLIGLHISVLIMIVLWGKRIRGYESPLDQYGLNLSSNLKVHDFLKGLVGGIFFVVCVHSLSVWLGFACISRLHLPPSSSHTANLLKAYGKFIYVSVRGLLTATTIPVVEELLFRSWLPDEIEADLNYHQSILISALAYAIYQRSPPSLPGCLFLSLALLGAKQKNKGSLFVPIGVRTGIMFSSFILQTSGLISYRPETPFWLRSLNPWHPFDGVIGLISSILLAIFLYPGQDAQQQRMDPPLQPEGT